MSEGGTRPHRDPRAPWRTAFSVLFALSAWTFLSPASEVPSGVPLPDKVIHGGLFAVLAATGVMAGLSRRAVLVVLAAWAIVSEVLQAVLPIERDGDVLDALADLVGLLVGLAAVTALRPRSGGTSRR